MNVEDYALSLLYTGAESYAEDDLNESGELDDNDDGDNLRKAISLSIDMAHAIRDNPLSFRMWYRQYRTDAVAVTT